MCWQKELTLARLGPGITAAQLPVAIDYLAALALRQMALVQDEVLKYLLTPEVSALLHYVPNLHRRMLLAILWNTGARIDEALALTRSDFSLAPPYPFVQLAKLKQRAEKAARTAGRAPVGRLPHRIVPLSDPQYVSQLDMMVTTLKIPLEHLNKRTGRTEKARIWEITDRTVRARMYKSVDAAAADGVTFSVSVTPHTFRDSYAIWHSAKGAAELNGTQVDQLDGSIYEGICARCCCQTQGTVFNGRGCCCCNAEKKITKFFQIFRQL